MYVLLVNWNGWAHTIECLESLFRQDYHPFVAVVCDNGSQDGSWEKMLAWARGELPFPGPQNPALAHLFRRPLAKPIPFVCYDRPTAEAGGVDPDPAVPLVFIQTGANLGFGGGNNVGLRYALARGDAGHVWLLNNDTVVAPDALRSLWAKAASTSRVGAVGSKILDYFYPEKILSWGGKRIRWALGGVSPLVRNAPGAPLPPESNKLDYIEGCSCLIPLETLRDVGLFDPAFFHFWEDVDLGYRITLAGYRLLYAEESKVYHKEGASTQGPSLQADCYEISSCVIFFRKYSKLFPLILSIKLLGKLFNRIYRKQFDRVYWIFRSFLISFFIPIRK
ncbi:MAG: glycosyltransferase family 2 protein [Desulfobaccales bacterium]